MPGKSNKKLIIGVVVAVIAIVIVLLVVFLLLGGVDSRFVGEWEYDTGYGVTNFKFHSDGKVETGYSGTYTDEGKWSVEGNKVCFKGSESWGESEESCYPFEFSDNNNKLTLKDTPMGDITFTKK